MPADLKPIEAPPMPDYYIDEGFAHYRLNQLTERDAQWLALIAEREVAAAHDASLQLHHASIKERDELRVEAAILRKREAGLLAERDALREELETERMRLVACDVVACSDTPESAAQQRQMLPKYRSAALESVIRRVDECIRLRALTTQPPAASEAAPVDEAVRKAAQALMDYIDAEYLDLSGYRLLCSNLRTALTNGGKHG